MSKNAKILPCFVKGKFRVICPKLWSFIGAICALLWVPSIMGGGLEGGFWKRWNNCDGVGDGRDMREGGYLGLDVTWGGHCGGGDSKKK